MVPIQETELAGIGRSFTVETRSGERFIIVVHDIGPVELYHAPAGTQEPMPIATLNDQEARQVAAIIGKTIFRPEAIERLARHGVFVTWHTLPPHVYAVGKTVYDLQVPDRTGAAIIAAEEKDGGRRTNLDPGYVFNEGDQVAIAGTHKEIRACQELLEKGPQ